MPAHVTISIVMNVSSLQLYEANNLSSSITFLGKSHSELTLDDFEGRKIDAVIGEPYFSSSLLPWHNLHFWYAVSSLQNLLAREHGSPAVVVPGKGFLMAIAGVCVCDTIQIRILVKCCVLCSEF